nr:PLDc N-terminal domain-containing protein [Nocardia nova]
MGMASGSWHVLAAAGLSDCAQANVCGDDMGLFVLGFVAVVLVGPVFVLLSVAATLDIIGRPTGVRRGVAWTAIVWLIPIAGALFWWSASDRRARSA